MKSYFLIIFSLVFLLFNLPKLGSVNSLNSMEQAVLMKNCGAKRLVKRTCAKKCFRHPSHSRQQDAAGVTTGCSSPMYAALFAQEQERVLSFPLWSSVTLATPQKYLSPHLKTDPDPPRFS
ncbi:hypothetical protein CLV24_1316 [Pontibacter ummariensis]|uniref:Uncharacterized protein n=1 Tax=Pontibacter ummariensis TaxID=1610492 RepID=A0A239KSL1_9BACT|nr:hypothetical protein [Pontibacter ummariensis]PRY04989.1 hypothetical protein CLV24_1316 [Pontibacter ummariensis]SNT20732.1 hypothetical protein SAMN06296052_1316 [Pontibacter ummariensis]